jgi:hypothetical protein
MSRDLGKPERGEVSVGQSDFQRWCVRKVPGSIGATRRFRGVGTPKEKAGRHRPAFLILGSHDDEFFVVSFGLKRSKLRGYSLVPFHPARHSHRRIPRAKRHLALRPSGSGRKNCIAD